MSASMLTGGAAGPADAANADDILTLVTNRQRLTGWTDIEVTRGIERTPSSCSIGMTARYPGNEDDIIVQPGDTCQVLIGADLVITGRVRSAERIKTSLDAAPHGLARQRSHPSSPSLWRRIGSVERSHPLEPLRDVWGYARIARRPAADEPIIASQRLRQSPLRPAQQGQTIAQPFGGHPCPPIARMIAGAKVAMAPNVAAKASAGARKRSRFSLAASAASLRCSATNFCVSACARSMRAICSRRLRRSE